MDDRRWDAFNRKRDAVALEAERCARLGQSAAAAGRGVRRVLGKGIERNIRCSTCCVVRVSYQNLMTLPGAGVALTDPPIVEQLEIQAKYQGYIDRQQEEVEKTRPTRRWRARRPRLS